MGNILQQAKEIREQLDGLLLPLSDEEAGKTPALFPLWESGKSYLKDERLKYKDVLYKVLQPHTSQADWTPDIAVSLYVRISDPAEEWPEWEQPSGAHDAYGLGDKVTHNGKHWISNVDNNTWEPGVYGWDEAEDQDG